jgi:hypothetical protein
MNKCKITVDKCKIIVVALFIFCSFALPACELTHATRDAYKTEDCFVCMECLAMNQKNPDKSICGRLCDCCAESLKDLRNK